MTSEYAEPKLQFSASGARFKSCVIFSPENGVEIHVLPRTKFTIFLTLGWRAGTIWIALEPYTTAINLTNP